jgi:hypothetical protein
MKNKIQQRKKNKEQREMDDAQSETMGDYFSALELNFDLEKK